MLHFVSYIFSGNYNATPVVVKKTVAYIGENFPILTLFIAFILFYIIISIKLMIIKHYG